MGVQTALRRLSEELESFGDLNSEVIRSRVTTTASTTTTTTSTTTTTTTTRTQTTTTFDRSRELLIPKVLYLVSLRHFDMSLVKLRNVFKLIRCRKSCTSRKLREYLETSKSWESNPANFAKLMNIVNPMTHLNLPNLVSLANLEL